MKAYLSLNHQTGTIPLSWSIWAWAWSTRIHFGLVLNGKGTRCFHCPWPRHRRDFSCSLCRWINSRQEKKIWGSGIFLSAHLCTQESSCVVNAPVLLFCEPLGWSAWIIWVSMHCYIALPAQYLKWVFTRSSGVHSHRFWLLPETGNRGGSSRAYSCPVIQCAWYMPSTWGLSFVLEVSGDLQFGEGIMSWLFWTECLTLVNSLHLMSFLSSVAPFLSWCNVSQWTKEDRQPGAWGTLLFLSPLFRHICERFCKWLPGFSPASVSLPMWWGSRIFPEAPETLPLDLCVMFRVLWTMVETC